jgi:hypothetical protein
MSGVYSMTGGPTYVGASAGEWMQDALDTPLSLFSTLGKSAKSGVLDSFGLGTFIKDKMLPEEAPTVPGTPRIVPNGEGGFTYKRETPEEMSQRRADMGALSEDQYKASPYYREDIPWDAGMTADRAAALAQFDDAKKARDFFTQKRPFVAFIGGLGGQAIDPINYIPVFGEAVQSAQVARFGYIGGRLLTSAADAALNTGIASIATAGERAKFGDDVSWQATISQMATAALLGGAFGALHGAFEGRGARLDATARADAESRLSDLKTTQEARIALNEGIDALVNGEDIRLSPNATDPMARVAGEIANLSNAYDQVKENPTGDIRDPLVAITPDDIEGTLVARGAFKDVNNLEFSDRGYGLVKIIWGHGEHSPSSPEFQVTKENITALPSVIRAYEPAKVSADGARREWRVQDAAGRTVVYADKVINGDRHLVTAYVQEPNKKGFDAPLSKERASQSVPSGVSTTPMDTAGGFSAGLPGVTKRPDANIAQQRPVDNTTANPVPRSEGVKQAEASVAKPENTKALAAQFIVDPNTGSFPEEADVAQLATEGRLTEQDAVTLAQAEADYQTGSAFAEALKSVAGCLI